MKEIDHFVAQAERLLDEAAALTNRSFRMVLYLVMIDALGKVRFPEQQENRKRFIDFVQAHGGWSDGERVSLPQAELALRKIGGPPEQVTFVSRRLGRWEEATFHDLCEDPLGMEFPHPLGELERCRHVSLLWEFRNTLLHEFRQPGLGMDFGVRRDTVHYMQVESERALGQSTWELIIPDGFLEQLARQALASLAGWLRSEGRNPWEEFEDGRTWVRKFT
jgi:hypothetical protein